MLYMNVFILQMMYGLLTYLRKVYQKEISILKVIYELLPYSNKFGKKYKTILNEIINVIFHFSSHAIFVL